MSESLKLRKDISDETKEQATSDFWYDMFEGGYIKPENYLVEADVEKVREARKLLREFRALVEDNELIGEM